MSSLTISKNVDMKNKIPYRVSSSALNSYPFAENHATPRRKVADTFYLKQTIEAFLIT